MTNTGVTEGVSLFCRFFSSGFEPRVSCDGGLTAVSVVVEQLLALVDVARGNEDEVRVPVDVVQFSLAVPGFAVIDQPALATGLSRGVHTVENTRGEHLVWKIYNAPLRFRRYSPKSSYTFNCKT